MIVLTTAEVRARWSEIEPAITKAMSRNGPPTPLLHREVIAAILNGQAKVLVGNDGIGVAFIDGDVCNLIAYTGTLREIKLLKDQFVALARKAGCKKIRITGDPAWMRVVRELRQRSVVMEMDITADSIT